MGHVREIEKYLVEAQALKLGMLSWRVGVALPFSSGTRARAAPAVGERRSHGTGATQAEACVLSYHRRAPLSSPASNGSLVRWRSRLSNHLAEFGY